MICKLLYGPAHGREADFGEYPEKAFRFKKKSFKKLGLFVPEDARGAVVKYRRIGQTNGKEYAVYVSEEGE